MCGIPGPSATTDEGPGALGEFGRLDTDAQTILLLAFRGRQPQRLIAQIARCSERAVSYKIPASLAQLARLLDRASML